MQLTKKMKGFTVQSIGPLAIALVVGAIVISMGGEILSNLQGEQTANSVAYNVTGKGLSAMTQFGNWLPTIALIIAAAVIIGILVVYLSRGIRE